MSVIKHHLNYVVANIDDDNSSDDSVDSHPQREPSSPSPEANVQPEEFGSFVTDGTYSSYQTENSNYYAEIMTARKYVLTSQRLGIFGMNEENEHTYDNSSISRKYDRRDY